MAKGPPTVDRVSVGTSGWSYPSWRPGFYPAGARTEEFLALYAARLPAVELNASGIYKAGEIYPSPWILRECHRRGIPSLVTTDAHHIDEVMRGYDEGVAELRKAGYTQQAIFAGRKRTLVAL